MGRWYDYIKASIIQSQLKTSHNIVTVISFYVKSSSMNKQHIILAIIITSVLALGTIGFGSFAMGQSNDSSFQTSNQTNTAENASGSAVKMQIDEALKSLESNDLSGALVHMQEADKNSSGQLKIHIEDAIKSLEANDASGTLIHIQLAQQNL